MKKLLLLLIVLCFNANAQYVNHRITQSQKDEILNSLTFNRSAEAKTLTTSFRFSSSQIQRLLNNNPTWFTIILGFDQQRNATVLRLKTLDASGDIIQGLSDYDKKLIEGFENKYPEYSQYGPYRSFMADQVRELINQYGCTGMLIELGFSDYHLTPVLTAIFKDNMLSKSDAMILEFAQLCPPPACP